MLNQVVLVGRLVQNPEISPLENGKKKSSITLAVSRSFKNMDGEYETDFINCVLWNGIAENTCEYCKKGDIVGVKGRIQTRTALQEDSQKKYYVDVVAEKVTFLSSKKEE